LNKNEENLIIERSIVVKKPAKIGPLVKKRPVAPRETSAEGSRAGMRVLDRSRVGIRVGNDRNFMIRMAQCCEPSTGDRIVGYVSRGRGIIIHKEGCPNLSHIRDIEERSIEVEWETISPRATRRFKVTAREAADIFSEIEGALKKYEGHLIAGKLHPNAKGTLTGYFTVEIDRTEEFKRVVKDLRMIPSIINIQPTRNYS
jgi:GTP pyrophosphokinase